MASDEANRHVELLALHGEQVMAGLIPEDSPPTFVLLQPTDERGLPWWFGPHYAPTPEAIEAFGAPEN